MATLNYDDDAKPIGPRTAYREPSRGLSGMTKILISAVVLFTVAAFGWVIWIAYDEGVRTGAVKTVPVIKADLGQLKRKPADPGGLVVPHQDKLVFNRLAPGQANEPVERLLPLPETPIALPVSDSSQTPVVKSVGSPPNGAETQVATALTPKLVEPKPDHDSRPKAVVAPPSPPAPPPEPAELEVKAPPSTPADTVLKVLPAPSAAPPDSGELVAKTTPPAATPLAVKPITPPAPARTVEKAPQIAAGAAWRIQLYSLSSRKDAEAVWTRLQKANGDLLGGLELQVQTAKLSKGTFYRVQAGPLPNRAAAASLCGTLKSRKQDCLVVAPKR